MDIRKLRYLMEAIEQGSLSRAAGRLRISQPALTKAVNSLESELSVKLLDRTSSGVIPTAFGTSLYNHARAIAGELSHARREIETLREQQEDRMSIGTLSSLSIPIIGRAVLELRKRHKSFPRIRVVEKPNAELIDGLRKSEFDLVLARSLNGGAAAGLKQKMLLTDQLYIVARANHPLAERVEFTAIELIDQLWAIRAVEGEDHPLAEQFFRAAGLRAPKPCFEASSVPLLISIVEASDCLTMLPLHAVSSEVSAGRLRVIQVRPATPVRKLAIIYKHNHALTEPNALLIRQIERTCRDYGLKA